MCCAVCAVCVHKLLLQSQNPVQRLCSSLRQCANSRSFPCHCLLLQALQQTLPPEVSAVMSGQQQQLFLPDAAAIKAAGLSSWSWLPPATGCLLLVTLPGVPEGGLLVVAGDRAR
jgi:hypothetical protein